MLWFFILVLVVRLIVIVCCSCFVKWFRLVKVMLFIFFGMVIVLFGGCWMVVFMWILSSYGCNLIKC